MVTKCVQAVLRQGNCLKVMLSIAMDLSSVILFFAVFIH